MSNISQKAWDYALISLKGDVVPEANMEYLAANIQVILDIEAANFQAEIDALKLQIKARDARPEGAPAAS